MIGLGLNSSYVSGKKSIILPRRRTSSLAGITSGSPYGNYAHADGVNDDILMTVNSTFGGATNFSISLWIKFDVAASFGRVVAAFDAGQANGFAVINNNVASGQLVFTIRNGGTNFAVISPTSLFAIDTWVHFGFYWDTAGATNADKGKIFKNGVELSCTYSGTSPATCGVSGLPMRFFRTNTGTTPLAAGLDEVAMWDVASASKITNHYNGGNYAEADAANLVRYYKMNEENPSTLCPDQTGNDDGTLQNFNPPTSGYELRV